MQKYKVVNEDTNMVSEPSSPQSSTRSRSPSPDDILERVAADVKEYERENLNTFEASIKAKHNLIAQEKDGKVLVTWLSVGIQGQLNEPQHQSCTPYVICGGLWQDLNMNSYNIYQSLCTIWHTEPCLSSLYSGES